MIPNPYREKRRQSPGEREVGIGWYAVAIARALGVPMPLEGDKRAIQRTGELLKRWWRALGRR